MPMTHLPAALWDTQRNRRKNDTAFQPDYPAFVEDHRPRGTGIACDWPISRSIPPWKDRFDGTAHSHRGRIASTSRPRHGFGFVYLRASDDYPDAAGGLQLAAPRSWLYSIAAVHTETAGTDRPGPVRRHDARKQLEWPSPRRVTSVAYGRKLLRFCHRAGHDHRECERPAHLHDRPTTHLAEMLFDDLDFVAELAARVGRTQVSGDAPGDDHASASSRPGMATTWPTQRASSSRRRSCVDPSFRRYRVAGIAHEAGVLPSNYHAPRRAARASLGRPDRLGRR